MTRPKTAFTSKRARFILVGFSVFFALMLCEVIVRVGGFVPRVHAIWRDDPHSIYRRSANPLLGHELKSDFKREFPNGVATSNSHGLRDRERKLKKAAGVRRLIMVGDSVVEGVNYVPDADTPSRQLENVLTNTEVLNFGVSGYCTLAEVELLETRGLAFGPDEVIVVFTVNDFQNVVPEHTVASGVENRPRWAKELFVRSAVFRLACLKLNWFAFGEEQDPVDGNRLAIGENNVVDAFERLRVAANKHDFRVTIAIWPSFTAEKIEDFENERRIRLLVERLADMHGLPSLRLGRAFRSHYDEVAPTQDPATFYTVHADGMHPNGTAAKVAAQALKNHLNSERGSEPPYTLGKVDVRAIEEARIRGGQDDVPEDMTFEQRTFLSLRYQGRAEDSENYLRELIAAEPGHLFANAYLGNFLAERGEHEAAVPLLTVALEGRPDADDMRIMLAQSKFRANGLEAAIDCLSVGLERQPINPHCHFAAAQMFYEAGQKAKARDELNLVVSVAPEFPGVTDLLSRLSSPNTEKQ